MIGSLCAGRFRGEWPYHGGSRCGVWVFCLYGPNGQVVSETGKVIAEGWSLPGPDIAQRKIGAVYNWGENWIHI